MSWNLFDKKLVELGYSTNDRAYIERAFLFAKQAHEGQKRASGEPYFNHAAAVGQYVAELHLDAHTIAAALLHDVLEDCAISHKELTERFGPDVTFLVEGATKLGTIRYRGIQRKVESLRKMFFAVAEDVRVVLIKLADRLHNMQTIQYLPPEKQKRIAAETLEIYAPIAFRLGIGTMKGALEDLAFPVVHPNEYTWVKREVRRRVPEGEQYLAETIRPSLEELLEIDDVFPLSIDFRKKHLYSLWQKLLRHDMDFERMNDLLAMRIVVRTVEDCYRTLGIVHQLWRPIPGRIKDYISLPKHNGYRSLHTTVFCPNNKIVEFQIRTQEMHEEAEHGIAAHWAYREAGKPKQGAGASQQTAWVQKLSDWQKEIGSTTDNNEFLESLKIDFFKDRIFILTPKGEVLDLPAGATPVDFAYAIHTEIGDHMMGAKVNGKLVPFDRELSSGDTVDILTQKKKKTNTEWLSFVKTSLAKNRIRAATRGDAMPAGEAGKKQHRSYQCVITAKDRVGLLKDISAVFSGFRINIQHIAMNAKHKQQYPDIVVSFRARDERQIQSVATRLRAIPGVAEVAIKVQ